MRHKIRFPRLNTSEMDQDEAYFFLTKENGKEEKMKFHDYDKIYGVPGLYEQLFYDRLKCTSPEKVIRALEHTINQNKQHFSELKVLDFGAGNGMVAQKMKEVGVARLVGADILPEAKQATYRDRPDVYDEYYVKDFTRLTEDEHEELRSWNLNSLVSVAALGFGDIPTRAFYEAINLISDEGWIAFNIKETFLYSSDTSGFSKLIRELLFSGYFFINHLERYCHRISIEGTPLHYFAIVCWKSKPVPEEFFTSVIEE